MELDKTIDTIIEEHHKANFKNLVKRYTRPLGATQAAEDMVQEAYLRAWRYKHTCDLERGFQNWFISILNNTLWDQLNYEKGITFDELTDQDVGDDSDWQRFKELEDDVKRLIAQEREHHAELLTLYHIHRLTPTEITQITRWKLPAIYQVIRRFREKVLKG